MNGELILFSLFSSLTLIAAIMVIRAKNPVHSVLFLILVFCSTSGLLLLLGLDFFALIFLVVYVGAIAVLFLFVIMMLNIKLTEINENVLRYLPIGGLIGLVFVFEILLVIDNDLIPLSLSNLLIEKMSFFESFFFLFFFWFIPVVQSIFLGRYSITFFFLDYKQSFNELQSISDYVINFQDSLLGSYVGWISQVQNFSNIEMVAQLIYTHYVYYFLMASLVLLVAMIGAITLTMHQNVEVKRQDVFLQHVREFSTTVQKLR